MYPKLMCLVSFVLMLSIASNASANLVVHLSFDEGSGNVAHDTSGNSHDGALHASPEPNATGTPQVHSLTSRFKPAQSGI